MKNSLAESFPTFITKEGELEFGYTAPGHGAHGQQRWICDDIDLQDMYTEYIGKEITICQLPGHACPFASCLDMPVHLPVAWACLSIYSCQCLLDMPVHYLITNIRWTCQSICRPPDKPVHLTVSNACWTCLSICRLPMLARPVCLFAIFTGLSASCQYLLDMPYPFAS